MKLHTQKEKKKKPLKFWEKKENLLEFINKIKLKENLKTPEDWKRLTRKQVLLAGGNFFRKYSLNEFKRIACPEIDINNSFWENQNNISDFIKKLKVKYDLKNSEDWKKLTKFQIVNAGGKDLLKKISLYELKLLGCPDLIFEDYKNRKPAGYWDKIENVNQFLEELKEKYSLNSTDDWSKISAKIIFKNGGGSLLLSKKFSLYELKCLGCPDLKNISNYGKNNPKPTGYWDNIDNVKQFLNDLSIELNFNTPEDWNTLSNKHIFKYGGGSLLQKKKFSLFDLKLLACPDILKYSHQGRNNPKPSGYWNNIDNVKKFLLTIKDKYKIQSPADWNRISMQQIHDMGGGTLFSRYSTIYGLLSICFPEENWEKQKLSKNDKRSNQRWLFLQVEKLFPNDEIIEDYFDDNLSRLSGFSIQFDIFIPSKKMAFEYHGKQHYEDMHSQSFGSLELYKNRDVEKKRICKQSNISLIIVPYWWDNHLESLQELMNQALSEK